MPTPTTFLIVDMENYTVTSCSTQKKLVERLEELLNEDMISQRDLGRDVRVFEVVREVKLTSAIRVEVTEDEQSTLAEEQGTKEETENVDCVQR